MSERQIESEQEPTRLGWKQIVLIPMLLLATVLLMGLSLLGVLYVSSKLGKLMAGNTEYGWLGTSAGWGLSACLFIGGVELGRCLQRQRNGENVKWLGDQGCNLLRKLGYPDYLAKPASRSFVFAWIAVLGLFGLTFISIVTLGQPNVIAFGIFLMLLGGAWWAARTWSWRKPIGAEKASEARDAPAGSADKSAGSPGKPAGSRHAASDSPKEREERINYGCFTFVGLILAVVFVKYWRQKGGEAVADRSKGVWDFLVTQPLASLDEPNYWLGHPVGMLYASILWILILESLGRLSKLAVGGMFTRIEGAADNWLGARMVPARLSRLLAKVITLLVTVAATAFTFLILAEVVVRVTDHPAEVAEEPEPSWSDDDPAIVAYRQRVYDSVMADGLYESAEITRQRVDELYDRVGEMQSDPVINAELRADLDRMYEVLDEADYNPKVEWRRRIIERMAQARAKMGMPLDEATKAELARQEAEQVPKKEPLKSPALLIFVLFMVTSYWVGRGYD